MVRALLAGRKTQTRRILKDLPPPPADDSVVHPPKHEKPYFDAYCGGKRTELNPRGMTDHWCWWTRDDRAGHGCKVPYVPGDRLYVREEWSTHPAFDGISPRDLKRGSGIYTRADGLWHNVDDVIGWPFGRRRAGMHMPRWASRITLTVTNVRVQRLQDCSEEDAVAEGIYPWQHEELGTLYSFERPGDTVYRGRNKIASPAGFDRASHAYCRLWDNINGEGAWDKNPWIVAVSFSVEQRNIDEVPA